MKIGDKVHYIPWKGCDESRIENGIIKSFDNQSLNPFVVYHCNNDWENYMLYTGQSTNIESLKEGWVNEPEENYQI